MPKENKACPVCHYDVVEVPPTVRLDLKKKREKIKLPVRYMANQMHVTTNYIYLLENGSRSFNHDLIHRYLKALKNGKK